MERVTELVTEQVTEQVMVLDMVPDIMASLILYYRVMCLKIKIIYNVASRFIYLGQVLFGILHFYTKI